MMINQSKSQFSVHFLKWSFPKVVCLVGAKTYVFLLMKCDHAIISGFALYLYSLFLIPFKSSNKFSVHSRKWFTL